MPLPPWLQRHLALREPRGSWGGGRQRLPGGDPPQRGARRGPGDLLKQQAEKCASKALPGAMKLATEGGTPKPFTMWGELKSSISLLKMMPFTGERRSEPKLQRQARERGSICEPSSSTLLPAFLPAIPGNAEAPRPQASCCPCAEPGHHQPSSQKASAEARLTSRQRPGEHRCFPISGLSRGGRKAAEGLGQCQDISGGKTCCAPSQFRRRVREEIVGSNGRWHNGSEAV